MIRDKRRLQRYTTAILTALLVIAGFAWTTHAIAIYRTTIERQMAEDNEIVKANLNIIIHQVTQQYADRDMVISQIQNVLEALTAKGWNGFACVLDKEGRILAHPNRQMVDMRAPLKTYEPMDLLGSPPPPVDQLPGAPDQTRAIYRTQADIIAIDWLPELMTYLCVHKPHGPVTDEINALRQRLVSVGIFIIAVAAMGSWFFVGWIVDQYESHLARSETRNRTLVQNSAPIAITDAEGMILEVNPAAEMLFQMNREQLQEQSLYTHGFTDCQDALQDLLRAKSDTTIERRDLNLTVAHGATVPIDVRTCRISYGDQDAVYFLIRDVTETRKARDEILEANRKLRELDQLKTDFINTVSHELRTPLTSIGWSTESLFDLLPKDDDTIIRLLTIVKDDNRRLSNLIEELLNFSRLDAGRLQPTVRDLDLVQLIQKTQAEIALFAEKKHITLAVASPPTLLVQADPEQLQRVVLNLLDNAIKYTPKNGRVSVRVAQQKARVTVTVSDTGIGIPPEHLARIFDKFYRTDQPDVLRERGTGLGLAIVKGIIEAHGGTIEAKSAVDQGTTMIITLPSVPGGS